MCQVTLAPGRTKTPAKPAVLWYPGKIWVRMAPPPRVAEPAWQTWPKVHSQSQVGATTDVRPPTERRSEVLSGVNGPDPSLYRSVALEVRTVSQPAEVEKE